MMTRLLVKTRQPLCCGGRIQVTRIFVYFVVLCSLFWKIYVCSLGKFRQIALSA